MTMTKPFTLFKNHSIENKSIFDFSLTKDDMQHINQLTRPDGRIANQDPAEYEEF